MTAATIAAAAVVVGATRRSTRSMRLGLAMRARMDRAGDVFGSSGNPNRGNEIGTEYIRHTDAGTVRVAELPPLYNDLRR